MVEIPNGLSDFFTLKAGGFHQFHIGSVPPVFQQLSNPLCGILPWNDLRPGAVNGRGTFGKMNPVPGIPCGNIAAVLFQTETAVINPLQSRDNFFHRFLLHILQSNDFPGIIGIAAKQEKVVDFFLRKRKSRGLSALCFVDKTDLLFFCEEKVQGQLLISSVITTSSACAFRLLMCLAQPS